VTGNPSSRADTDPDLVPGEPAGAAEVGELSGRRGPRVPGRWGHRPAWRRGAMWAFPIVVVLGALILTALQISGSSIAALGPNPAGDPGMLLGHARGIRSDEWLLTSPEVIGNVRRGLPDTIWVGLTHTFLPASGLGVPSWHWSEIFHPSDWGFFFLPIEAAFAWRWWVPLLAGLLGGYALLVQLTRRPLISGALAAVLALSPYSAWWSSSPSAIAGYLAATGACLVYAMRRRGLLAAAAWGLAAGFFATAAGLIMYPPWLVSVGLVILAVIVGVALDRRVGWLRFAAASGAGLAVFVPAMLEWTREALPSVSALAGTIYPGNRVSQAGGGSLRWLFDAPASLWWSGFPGSHRALGVTGHEVAANGTLLYTNVSEASTTWLPLPLVVVALVACLLSGRALLARTTASATARTTASATGSAGPSGSGPDASTGNRAEPTPGPWRWTPALVAGVMALLLAWALLPLPSWVGTITLLNRVPGYRTPLALGLAAVLLLAIGATAVERARPGVWFVALVALGGLATAATMIWATRSLPWSGGHPSLRNVVVLGGLAGLGFALLLLGRRLGVAGAVLIGVLAVAVYAPVNPVFRGLGPLDRDPLVQALRPYVTPGHPPTAAVYGTDTRLNSLVVSTGMESLTGLTVYPDRTFWQRIDPGQESLWNNYNKYAWVSDPTVDHPVIQPWSGTQRILRIDPCAASTRSLGIDFSVSPAPLDGSACLHLVTTVERSAGAVYVYRYAG
jgi:hypothetical protein